MPSPSTGALMQTAAFSIATILGSGILGLPVSLARAGLPPFFLSFTLTLVAQVAVVYATTELLQRASFAAHGSDDRGSRDSYELLPYETVAPPDATLGDVPMREGWEDEGDSGSSGDGRGSGQESAPGLHTFAELYLPGLPLKVLFETAVLFHFVSIMSSYALGAPQAFREVFPILKALTQTYLVLGFTIGAGLIVIFFPNAIVVPLTFATFVKGFLLSVMVCVVLAVGIGVGEKPTADWSFGAGLEPFLIGTLALSGVINLMPKLWDICVKSTGLPMKQAVDTEFVVNFRLATNAAVILCYVLNVMWCAGVLRVVPQTGTSAVASATSALVHESHPVLLAVGHALSESASPAGNQTAAVTLEEANALGQISTVPLVAVLKSGSHGFAATLVVNMVNVFIFISISVSFMVMGIGLCQLLDEMADSAVNAWQKKRAAVSENGRRVGSARALQKLRKAARLGLAAFVFSLVTAISANNPKAMLNIMAGITSLALNLEGGVLIMIMFVVSRRGKGSSTIIDERLDFVVDDNFHSIPAPIGSKTGSLLTTFVFTFFSFAVIVDVVKFIPTMFGW